MEGRGVWIAGIVTLLALGAWPVAEAATSNVRIEGFQLPNVAIQPGDTVSWQNLDATTHSATADDASFDTGALTYGMHYSRAFPAEGSFPYHCRYHPEMTATITVGNPNSPPTIALSAPAAGATVSGTVEVRGSAADANAEPLTIHVRIDDGAWLPPTTSVTVPSGRTWTYAWDTTTVANGAHAIAARVSDGRVTVESAARTVTVANAAPNSPPVLAWLEPTEGKTIGGHDYQVSLLADDADARHAGNLTVQVRFDDLAWVDAEPLGMYLRDDVNYRRFVLPVNTRELADGPHTLRARVTDGVDLVEIGALAITIENPPENTHPPSVAISAPFGGSVSGLVTLSVRATDDDGNALVLEARLGDGPWVQLALENGSVSRWAWPIDTTALAEGAILATARASDGKFTTEDHETLDVQNHHARFAFRDTVAPAEAAARRAFHVRANVTNLGDEPGTVGVVFVYHNGGAIHRGEGVMHNVTIAPGETATAIATFTAEFERRIISFVLPDHFGEYRHSEAVTRLIAVYNPNEGLVRSLGGAPTALLAAAGLAAAAAAWTRRR